MPPSNSPPSSVSPLSEEAIAELERKYREATAGEWFHGGCGNLAIPGSAAFGRIDIGSMGLQRNAEFVAALHNAFPALLAEVRAGREKLEAADAVFEDEEAAHLETLALLKQRTEERDRARHERDVFSSDNLRAERDAALAQRDDAVKRASALRAALELIVKAACDCECCMLAEQYARAALSAEVK